MPNLSRFLLYSLSLTLSIGALAQQPPENSGSDRQFLSNRFVVTNVATEMIRLYERCTPNENCKNKLLMEFHGTVGSDKNEVRTDVGVYATREWVKMYEVPGEYAGWYRPGYPELPSVGSRQSWLSPRSSPAGFTGGRGAFGWYTLFVGPNPDGQWMHGTYGWGADHSNLVRFQDSFLGGIASTFHKLGSHGCTRMSNEAIAYMRSNIPLGAAYIKIYAKETYRDPNLEQYRATEPKGRFDYTLTKVGYGKPHSQHETAATKTVIADGTPESEWLETGVFSYDQIPHLAKGDHYHLGEGSMAGVFNVDEGTLSPDYRHPRHKHLKISGFSGAEAAIPSFARSQTR